MYFQSTDSDPIIKMLKRASVPVFWADRIRGLILGVTVSNTDSTGYKPIRVSRGFPLEGAFIFERESDRKQFKITLTGNRWVCK